MNTLVKKSISSWQDWANGILGLWLIVSPRMLAYMSKTTATWNTRIVGAVVTVAACIALIASQKWVNKGLTAWLIASSWIQGFSGVQVRREPELFVRAAKP